VKRCRLYWRDWFFWLLLAATPVWLFGGFLLACRFAVAVTGGGADRCPWP
jgi:hypothetical protein